MTTVQQLRSLLRAELNCHEVMLMYGELSIDEDYQHARDCVGLDIPESASQDAAEQIVQDSWPTVVSYVLDRFNPTVDADGIHVWRTVQTRRPRLDGAGLYWSLDPNDCDAHWAPGNYDPEHTIHAVVQPDAVDWHATALARSHPLTGDEENELTLLRGAAITVVDDDDTEERKQATADNKHLLEPAAGKDQKCITA